MLVFLWKINNLSVCSNEINYGLPDVNRSIPLRKRTCVGTKPIHLQTEIQFELINMLLGFKNPEAGSGACTETKRRLLQSPHKNNIMFSLHRIHTQETTRTRMEGKRTERNLQREGERRLTESKLTRAKMAKVERLSHTHLVLNEWTGTALQLRVDQDPRREELHREEGEEAEKS